MLSTALTVIAVAYIAGMVALVMIWWKAPEGFEDESGFHFGTEERPSRAARRERVRKEIGAGTRGSMGTGTDWHTA